MTDDGQPPQGGSIPNVSAMSVAGGRARRSSLFARPDTRFGGPRPELPLRLILTAMSVIGVVAAGILTARGHGWLALRVLAGDVLLIFTVLLGLS